MHSFFISDSKIVVLWVVNINCPLISENNDFTIEAVKRSCIPLSNSSIATTLFFS